MNPLISGPALGNEGIDLVTQLVGCRRERR